MGGDGIGGMSYHEGHIAIPDKLMVKHQMQIILIGIETFVKMLCSVYSNAINSKCVFS